MLAQALASRPLLFLGCSLKTDRTTMVINWLAKRYPGVVHFALLSQDESTRERRQQLDLWNIRPLFFPAQRFERIQEFLRLLTDAADPSSPGQPSVALPAPAPRPTRINGYKLFYFRNNQKMGTKSLAQAAGVPEKDIVELERVDEDVDVLGLHCFQPCPSHVIGKLERALECPGALEAGQADDFLTAYTLFYRTYRGTAPGASRDEPESTPDFSTSAVVFDFDGTLTVRTDEETTWEKMWLKLGYTIDDCAQLHAAYSNGKITHQQWCELTLEKFKARGFSSQHLDHIVSATRLVDGTPETLSELRDRGIRLYIVSGSVKQVIGEGDPALGMVRRGARQRHRVRLRRPDLEDSRHTVRLRGEGGIHPPDSRGEWLQAERCAVRRELAQRRLRDPVWRTHLVRERASDRSVQQATLDVLHQSNGQPPADHEVTCPSKISLNEHWFLSVAEAAMSRFAADPTIASPAHRS